MKQRASSGMHKKRQLSVFDHNRTSDTSFFSPRESSIGGFERKNFGFRNHSHALGSTLRHFTTITDFPDIPQSLSKHKAVEKEVNGWQKNTKNKLPEIMAALKKDPRALDIFIEELAMTDKSQPKHMRFLDNI